MRRRSLIALASAFLISLIVGVSGAQALVRSDGGNQFGIAPLPSTTGTIASAPGVTIAPFKVRIQILPQSLKAMLRGGMTLRLSSNENASGIATLSIPRSAAKKAHIASGRAASVVIGRGTMSQIKSGTMKLHLGLSRATAAKLKRLGHVTMTVRLALVGSDGSHVAIVAAGRY